LKLKQVLDNLRKIPRDRSFSCAAVAHRFPAPVAAGRRRQKGVSAGACRISRKLDGDRFLAPDIRQLESVIARKEFAAILNG